MGHKEERVQGLRPDREVMTRQRLPYFIGISGQTVNATGLSMHIVVMPPGGRADPHSHIEPLAKLPIGAGFRLTQRRTKGPQWGVGGTIGRWHNPNRAAR